MDAADMTLAPRLCCNGCWSEVDSKEHVAVPECGHMYCLNCCQTIMDSDDPTCPICSKLVQKSNVKAQRPLQPARELAFALTAQSPECIMEVANFALQFYNRQQALYAEYANATSQRKIAKTQDQCRKKLQEVHTGYLNAKRKYQEVLEQKHALQSDNKELQDKYNQKAMQDKKLKEAFARLQQENEALRRHINSLQKGGGGGGGGMAMPGMQQAFGLGGAGGGATGRASRMGVLGMDDGMAMRPGTVLAPRAMPPDPSPLSSMLGGAASGGYGGGRGGNMYVYDTPENQPVLRKLQNSGGSGNAGRLLSGGLGRPAGLGGGDKRQAMGFNAPHNSMATM